MSVTMVPGNGQLKNIYGEANEVKPSFRNPLFESSIEPAAQVDALGKRIQTTSISERENLNLGGATVPCFDLEDIQNAALNERNCLVMQLINAWREYGFIGIKAESLTPLIQNVYKEMDTYFHKELQVKMLDFHNNFGQTGYAPRGNEKPADGKVPDLKETYFINYSMFGDPTKWPKDQPKFREAMEAYHAELATYAAKFMQYFFEYLGEKGPDAEETLKTKNNLLRLAFYPKREPTDPVEAFAAGPHEDLNWATFLPPATTKGLEMLRNGEWIPVEVPPGYLIINTGEAAQYKTAGMFKAITHRVKVPEELGERLASIFFAAFAPDYDLMPFESCLKAMTVTLSEADKEKYRKGYTHVTSQEYTDARLIEMGSIKEPPREMVQNLTSKGLLKKAPEAIKAMFPDLF